MRSIETVRRRYSGTSLTVYGWQVLGRLAPQVLSLGISVAMVRIAGVATVGQYAVSLTLTMLTIYVAGTALDTQALRLGTRNAIAAAGLAKVILWIALIPLVSVSLWFLEVPLVGGLCVYGAGLFMGIAELITVRHRCEGNDREIILPRVLPPFIFLLSLVVFAPTSFPVVALLFLLSWLVVLWYSRGQIWAAVARSDVVAVMRGASLLVGMTFFTLVHGNADLIVIKSFLDHGSAGEYRLAQSLASVMIPVIGVLAFVYLSEVRSHGQLPDAARMRGAFQRQFLLHLVIGISVFAIMFVSLPSIVVLLYGAQGEPAIAPAIVLTGAAAVNAIATVCTYTLVALHRDRMMLLALALGGLVNVVMNVLLVPRYGLAGAAWTGLFSQCVLLVAVGFLALRYIRDGDRRPEPAADT